MEQLIGPIVLVLAIVALALLVRAFVSVVTVHDYERGLRYRSGRFTGLVDPGSHIVIKPFTEVRVMDGRPAFLVVEGQEVLTSDGVAVKVSLAARYVVGDPVAAVTSEQDFRRAMYLELQLGLRDAIAAGTVEEVLAARSKIGPAVLERTASLLAKIGVELLSVEVRDLMVPGELKRLFAGVVAARKEGQASLERVRAETAALRGLANAGRMIEDNPGLLQLRMLQQVGGSTGNTVLLSMPDGHGGAPGGGADGASAAETARRSRARASEPETSGG
ncbi:MAG TPA: slipin family protein [Candidatus Limnocylindrales bacterium]|nr:slipin family protein [Candidatus Limnocylindrales bacterium]